MSGSELYAPTTLHGLVREIESLVSRAYDLETGEEINPEIAAYVDGLQEQRDRKLVACGYVLKRLKAEAAELENFSKQLRERAKRVERSMDHLSDYVLAHMEAKEKVTDGIITVREKRSRFVNVIDEKLIPKEYWVQPPIPDPRLDKRAIADAIDTGSDVPGACMGETRRVEVR